jgi:hypothetical protein
VLIVRLIWAAPPGRAIRAQRLRWPVNGLAPLLCRLDYDTQALPEDSKRGIDLIDATFVKPIAKTAHCLFIGAELAGQSNIRNFGRQHGIVQPKLGRNKRRDIDKDGRELARGAAVMHLMSDSIVRLWGRRR